MMGGLVAFIGACAIVVGASELFEFGTNKDFPDWKNTAIKIVGGIAVAVIGIVMQQYGI